ncbi:tRNA (adenosine(37)-N6)-dimethylallyltransferase MiaA [Helicobacter saguini]|uniref:tRNA dimethylallyltransferase n=1 Tax=Helicobacter saguini TaxID=1548018 RepID=A0A347VSV9_9HELI|nr:tRNA (adenosine(37)-N6)-dimethylallyltransferase MiaA [Helicobacter saguini]MWV62344.1 tRNA (adenosine(37)-N6)-dimethylallyltransferase MiaA [Helicobacter saguini]MWV66985.1 tRNA (adenosine(37)-N6)-dimethylallyltransferase MiaA [Helicobacter saguini]MWV69333.1 tRNA (adenosine(37)-N6)-dimethylallyltransferase MiaA [Helicobacter saguini]MWV71112.1 tRNA (adenosine(37)-N6)-dimethylallyltransferase MiaA [Helicobacter saguini]TLD94993.1 tRNA (adenosine(37)-N6)-dimethylallyltransferase MiaA [Helic
MKILAIIGATCSGKSALALNLASKINAYIFSIDSLSIYKEINIASAKPTKAELDSIKHFAIDVLSPVESVNAGVFIRLLDNAITECKKDSKNLVIVGGSSFYLKSIIQGLSNIDSINIESKFINKSLSEKYVILQNLDSIFAAKISQNDTYRINKALSIFEATGKIPSVYFKENPPKPFPHKIDIYNLQIPRDVLIERINKRTKSMIKQGLIDEAKYILESYGDSIQPFKSIGLKECLLYFKGQINLSELESMIAIHTRQLAKRQSTFNKTQFENIVQIDSNIESILKKIT